MKTKLRYSDISTRRTFQGAWECSAIIDNHFVSRQYFGFSKAEAIRMFIYEQITTENA